MCALEIGLLRLLHNAELLNGEIFYALREAQVLIEAWPLKNAQNREMETTMN